MQTELDDLQIPAFLRRTRTETTRSDIDHILGLDGAPRVWAPIRSAAECKANAPKKTVAVYAADPEFRVHVVMGEPVQNIQQYENFADFQNSHDFDDYPVKKILTAGGVTYVQVTDHSGDGIVATRAPGAPRKAGTRDVIWKRADELWSSAGKPTDVPTVLKLRKEWMNVLEKEGVKKTTSSSELGNWQKDRVAQK